MSSRGVSKWFIYVETFVLVAAMTYISDIVVDAVYEDSGLTVPTEVMQIVKEYPHTTPGVCAEAHEKCAERLSVMSSSFILAFMAGGFMNFERVQGLPIP